MPDYTTEDLLPLSGIQHFGFCRRQWALIHVERQWQENTLTAEGRILHERVEDPYFTESRPGVIISRALPVASYKLGLAGVCDVVEFHQSETGARLQGRSGLYQAIPVEYKRGRAKQQHSDDLQLCAQAMCLEEMLSLSIPEGHIYYAQTRRRQRIELTPDLRQLVERYAAEMQDYTRRGYTPKVKMFKGCKACSLIDICIPATTGSGSAQRYIQQILEEG